MCSVIGHVGRYDTDLLNDLFDASRIRGLHAFGYAYHDNGIQHHRFLDYNQFKESIHSTRPDKFVAHFRYSTSGDHSELRNNQPLIRNNQALVFNGVIDQGGRDEMMTRHQIDMPTDNDGWVLFARYNDKSWLRTTQASFAMLVMDHDTIVALRNRKRPLYWHQSPDRIVIGSTQDIMLRSGLTGSKAVTPNKLHTWR